MHVQWRAWCSQVDMVLKEREGARRAAGVAGLLRALLLRQADRLTALLAPEALIGGPRGERIQHPGLSGLRCRSLQTQCKVLCA